MRLQEWLVLLAVIGVLLAAVLLGTSTTPPATGVRPPEPEPPRGQFRTIGDYCRAKWGHFRRTTGSDLGPEAERWYVHTCMEEEMEKQWPAPRGR